MAALDLKASSGPFVVDPRYEFDAPQFWDLNKVSQGLESPEPEADSWFDAGARADHSPRRPAAQANAKKEELPGNELGNQQKPSEPETGGRRASFGLGDYDDCLDDAMDVDSPVPAAAVQRVAAPETHRPVTRSQSKIKGTASRVLRPINDNTLKQQQGAPAAFKKSASSMKRVLEPICQLPVRSTKPLTEPMDFELQTSKRHRTHPTQTRTTPSKGPEEYVSLVERTRLFYEGPNDRFAADRLGRPQVDSRAAPALTNPKTPHLRSKTRAASRPAAPSHMAAESAVSAAVAAWEKSLGSRSAANFTEAKKASAPSGPTKAAPFRFATDQRVGTAPAPEPEHKTYKASSKSAAAPAAPKFHTTERAHKRAAQGGFVFKAEGGNTAVAPHASRAVREAKRHTVTKTNPFNLRTEKRGACNPQPKQEPEGHHAYHFRARPVPITNNVQNVPHKNQAPRNLTVPESPGLLSTRRHAAYQEQQRRKQEEDERKRKEAASFKARGILMAQPFMPQPSHQQLTVPHQPHFALDQRSEARSAYDQAHAERERAAEAERQAAASAKRQHEEEEVKHLRKAMVPRARAMPDFAHPFCPAASGAPLTEAHSPRLSRRQPRRHHQAR